MAQGPFLLKFGFPVSGPWGSNELLPRLKPTVAAPEYLPRQHRGLRCADRTAHDGSDGARTGKGRRPVEAQRPRNKTNASRICFLSSCAACVCIFRTRGAQAGKMARKVQFTGTRHTELKAQWPILLSTDHVSSALHHAPLATPTRHILLSPDAVSITLAVQTRQGFLGQQSAASQGLGFGLRPASSQDSSCCGMLCQ